jgi:hypothetical protein
VVGGRSGGALRHRLGNHAPEGEHCRVVVGSWGLTKHVDHSIMGAYVELGIPRADWDSDQPSREPGTVARVAAPADPEPDAA